MSKVFVDLAISLDGFIAGSNGGAKNPLGDNGLKIHEWMFNQRSFRKHLGMQGGETNNPDNDLIEKTFNRIGANIMGKNMFVEGEANWPEESPFHCDVYVLTKEKRSPLEKPGGTTFYFTNDTITSVLDKAKSAAGKKDVRISGGANIVQQYLHAGFVDELILHVAPLLLGKGVRLFDNIEKEKFSVEISDVINSPTITHIFYKVINH
ncbi:MAG TPA: dihydrofolate reductase family protein [Ignavibacteriaceae bacterium]|nr:dihydrofolate reductase family protein [Ignavibacteriaceae bacterium]